MDVSKFLEKVGLQVQEFGINPPFQCRIIHTENVNESNVRFEVETCCCGKKFQWIFDLNPSGADMTPKNISNHIPKFYDTFCLSRLPLLQSWSSDDVKGLIGLTRELRDTFNAIQLEMAVNHSNRRICFSVDIVKDFTGFECLIENQGDIHLVFPLYNEKVSTDPLHCIKVHAIVKSSPSDGGYADVELELPAQMALSASYNPSKWDLSISLWDYLPPVQLAIQSGWLKRKELIEALVATFSVLEYDPIDYSTAYVMVKSKTPKSKVTRVIELRLPMEYPEKAPEMTIHDMQGTQTWVLDPVLYRYSPRWTAHRIGEELLQHARTVNNQAWL